MILIILKKVRVVFVFLWWLFTSWQQKQVNQKYSIADSLCVREKNNSQIFEKKIGEIFLPHFDWDFCVGYFLSNLCNLDSLLGQALNNTNELNAILTLMQKVCMHATNTQDEIICLIKKDIYIYILICVVQTYLLQT